ncbi:hypothetical protein BDA99DRAFT_542855 [Phascolomyces articulosus]|uniref:Uncharacterized protein n=1 Tax=Phascolomyces articulosus TaxID=60185 RepID=A0AAD5JZB8_9FUNG|nr:hypothetical protein BDA99DRAFT_542855 [Phascolomyces articulosus]
MLVYNSMSDTDDMYDNNINKDREKNIAISTNIYIHTKWYSGTHYQDQETTCLYILIFQSLRHSPFVTYGSIRFNFIEKLGQFAMALFEQGLFYQFVDQGVQKFSVNFIIVYLPRTLTSEHNKITKTEIDEEAVAELSQSLQKQKHKSIRSITLDYMDYLGIETLTSLAVIQGLKQLDLKEVPYYIASTCMDVLLECL